MKFLPGAIGFPTTEVVVHRLPFRQVVRQQSPSTPRFHYIEHSVNNKIACLGYVGVLQVSLPESRGRFYAIRHHSGRYRRGVGSEANFTLHSL